MLFKHSIFSCPFWVNRKCCFFSSSWLLCSFGNVKKTLPTFSLANIRVWSVFSPVKCINGFSKFWLWKKKSQQFRHFYDLLLQNQNNVTYILLFFFSSALIKSFSPNDMNDFPLFGAFLWSIYSLCNTKFAYMCNELF